jgi:UDP-glucose 4-epimerase
MSLSGEKILITGASGFIGSHLSRRLSSLGAEVHGVSRRKIEQTRDGIRWWQGDLVDPGIAEGIMSAVEPDVVLHLASEVVGSRSRDLVLPTFDGNLLTTINVLLAASELGCRRVVVTGSVEEPDPGDPRAVPSSPYAAAKWACTGYARMFHALYGLDVVVLRVFMTYGPAQADVRKLIPFVSLALLRGELPTLGSGLRPVDWIYVDDVVEAFVAAVRTDGIAGKVLDVGTGSLVTVRAVAERLARMIRPDAALEFGAVPDRPLEQVRKADAARTRAALGWRAATSLEEGLTRTVEWYRRQVAEGALR